MDMMIDITNEAMGYFENQDFDSIGRLLDKAWKVKKTFASGISNKNIDDMYNLAINNIKEAKLDNRINVIFKDAFIAYDDIKDNKYDLIFIDAAKAQYHKFFDLFTNLLNESGVVVCDNMLFHGLVESESNDYSRSVRGLIRKLKEFHEYLLNNSEFDSSIYDIGDGMAISIKK